MSRLPLSFLTCFIIFAASGSLQAQVPVYVSEYTPIGPRSCKAVKTPGRSDEDGPNDDFQQKCPGRDGYAVDEVGGDARSWLVLSKGRDAIDLYGLGTEDLVFPIVQAGKLEWRYRVEKGQKQLVAVIFRMSGHEPQAYEAGDFKKQTSMLYAVRIDLRGYCLLGKAKTNEAARHLTDGGANCELKSFQKNAESAAK